MAEPFADRCRVSDVRHATRLARLRYRLGSRFVAPRRTTRRNRLCFGLCFGLRIASLVACLSVVLPTAALADDKFTWSITPYLWASQTKVDLTFRDEALGGDTISFGDLLDELDGAIMINAEAGRGRWSVFADLTWLETSAREQRPVFLVDSKAETTVLDTGVAWWPGGVGSELSVLAGVRYSGFDNRYRFFLGDQEVSSVRDEDDYLDALLGLRYFFDLGNRWELLTHADYSFGDSEGTWLLRATFARTVGRRGLNRFVFGYQYKEAEFVSGDLRSEFSYHGPVAGFNFRF